MHTQIDVGFCELQEVKDSDELKRSNVREHRRLHGGHERKMYNDMVNQVTESVYKKLKKVMMLQQQWKVTARL